MKASRRSRRGHGTAARGFSLVELLVVVAIIAIMGAIALPAIARYIRNYRIRAAGQMVATELATARARAINTNTQRGVLFVPAVNANFLQFQFWVEDDPANPGVAPAVPIAPTTGPPNGTIVRLPPRIQFQAPPGPGAAWTGRGLRFDRLGRACVPGTPGTTCTNPNAAAPATQYIWIGQIPPNPPGLVAGPWRFVLVQQDTGLTSVVEVEPGGGIRVR